MTIERVVSGIVSTRFIRDKGRRILITGMTHMVIAEACGTDVNFKQLNGELRITRNCHAFWLCEPFLKLLRRRLCLNADQVRTISVDRLTRWIVHYTPKWLRYREDGYSMQEDIAHAIVTTIAKK